MSLDEQFSVPPSTASVEDGAFAGRRAGWLGRLLRFTLDWVVPPVCLACRTPLAAHDALCARCWSRVAFIRQPLCDRLGLPLPFGGGGDGPLISAAAAADPPVYDRARAVGVYERDGVLQELVQGFKYADRHDARRLFGAWLADAGSELLAGADLLVPVPLARWRLVRRQFNQSAILCRELSARTGVAWSAGVLVKRRTTRPQVGLTRDQRRDNVRGVFQVPERRRPMIAGRNVVLVDDVITTGATVESAARSLKQAGAVRVDVLTIGLVTSPTAVTL